LPDDTVDNRENLVLVSIHDFAEGGLITRLSPLYQSAFRGVLIVHSGLLGNLATERKR
jgi:hypothetical protein